MEMTQRSEEDVCCALYECDNDLERSVIFLLEQLPVNAFETTSKKKKNKNKEEVIVEGEWNDVSNVSEAKEKYRNRSQVTGSTRNNSNRPREKRRDDRINLISDFKVDTFRAGNDRTRNFKNNLSRGERPGRNNLITGKGSFRGNRSRNQEHQEIDSWDASQGITIDKEKQQEITIDTWGDWDNEEYTGSLTDSKVFTPSTSTNQGQHDFKASSSVEKQIKKPGSVQEDSFSPALHRDANSLVNSNQSQYPELHSGTNAAQHLRQALELPLIQPKSLSAEQSQYFNTLSSQSSSQVNAYTTSAVQYSSNYGNVNQYNSEPILAPQQGSQTRRQRARVPPPSKIPDSAVEMPGDSLNNIGYLDVQFGGLDLGHDDSFDEKFSGSSLEIGQGISTSEINDFPIKPNNHKTSLSGSGLPTKQVMPSSDALNQNDALTSRTSNNGPSIVSSGSTNYSLSKTDPYVQAANAGYQSNTAFASTTKVSSFSGSYGSNNYSATHVSNIK